MFILSPTSSSLEFWSVNHTSVYENFDFVFRNIKFLVEMSNDWPNYLFGTNVYKALELHW